VALTGVALLVGFVGTGVFIFYNTNIRNHYLTRADLRRRAFDYERAYKAREKDPLPRIEETRVRVELDPAARSLQARGEYLVRNKTSQPITRVLVSLPESWR
jgi:hypothetical protein